MIFYWCGLAQWLQYVLLMIWQVYPWIVLTQPVTALAFVLDGARYGAGGFEYAAKATALGAAPPAILCMLLGLQVLPQPELALSAVWLGLTVLMAMRAATIYVPYYLKRTPFDKLQVEPIREKGQ